VTNEDQQLILTCINELAKHVVRIESQNSTTHRAVITFYDSLSGFKAKLDANEQEARGRYERLLTLISVLHDAKAKRRPQPKRRKGKR
jgi:hypothetical protein